MTITFGFEAEFTDGADRVIHALTAAGFAMQPEGSGGTRGLHGYHCDCGGCRDLIGNPFRAQRDSSCGGEIISGIFRADDWDRATECMHALQEAALDTDAGIDTRCGMHVHIGATDTTELASPEALTMSWLGVEPLLWEHVAGAAWAGRRGSQNNLLSTAILDRMQNDRIWDNYGIYPRAENEMDGLDDAVKEEYVRRFKIHLQSMGWDRHCDLARAQHGGLYEMRIFNATRVAWRIELACRLSVALAHPEVAAVFADKTDWWLFNQRSQLGNRMQALRNGYRRVSRSYSRRSEAPLQASLPVPFDLFMDTLTDFDERLGELLQKQTGYARARKQIGVHRGAISNVADLSGFRHAEVLALMNGGTSDG